MEYTNKEFCLEVWGDYACFTRPELKVERVSYDVITPSAARAIFQAIFWKPAIQWRITRIEVMNPIVWFPIKRNEVGATASPQKKQVIIEEYRQQRSSLLLKDVRYRIYAELEFIAPYNRVNNKMSRNPDVDNEEKDLLRQDENPGKYNAMFERRAMKGQCFNQPYLGCREFSCNFKLINPIEKENGINQDKDFGIMLYDLDYTDNKNPKPMFYRAIMEQGVIIVPQINSKEVLR